MTPRALLLVGLGGALGAIARFVVANLVAGWLGTAWPWGTFLINVSGCFAIGAFMTAVTERLVALPEAWRFLFPIGFVGAYTTFSTFEYETALLVERGAWPRALGYVLASIVTGFLAVAAGTALARRFL